MSANKVAFNITKWFDAEIGSKKPGFCSNGAIAPHVDDIVAGTYELTIRIIPRDTSRKNLLGRTTGTVKRQITLPDVTPDLRNQPFNLGQLELGVTRLPNTRRNDGH